MQNTFFPPDTNCKDCVFGNRQRCSIGKDLHYQNLGVVLDQVDKWTTVLKDFTCPYFRDKTWVDKQLEGLDEIQQLTIGVDEYFEIVEKENVLPYFVVYFVQNTYEAAKAIEKIQSFTVQPNEVFFVLDDIGTKDDAIAIAKLMKQAYPETKWHMHHQIDNDAWHNIYKHYNRTDFMLLMCNDPVIPNNWADNITDKVQNQLVKFIYAANEKEDAVLVHGYVYNQLYFTYGPNWISALGTTPCQLRLSL